MTITQARKIARLVSEKQADMVSRNEVRTAFHRLDRSPEIRKDRPLAKLLWDYVGTW